MSELGFIPAGGAGGAKSPFEITKGSEKFVVLPGTGTAIWKHTKVLGTAGAPTSANLGIVQEGAYVILGSAEDMPSGNSAAFPPKASGPETQSKWLFTLGTVSGVGTINYLLHNFTSGQTFYCSDHLVVCCRYTNGELVPV